jgi:hypothetical protein
MNWYAYKVLADSYDADRRRQAQAHRRSRQAVQDARTARGRHVDVATPSAPAAPRAATEAGSVRSGRWPAIVARLRRRPAAGVGPELRPT